MIRAGQEVPEGFTARTDVCIIGSGAGGGVVAGLLAEGGREVLVLEEGQHVPGSKMNQREEQMYPLLYRDGGNQLTADGGISVLQGRTLGGSTVINMADVVPIHEAVVEHWRSNFGCNRYSYERVDEAAREAMEAIHAKKIAMSRVNRANRLLLAGAKKLGWSADTFVDNAPGCPGSGYCLVGCHYDAKQSVAVTWVPRALATGRALFQTDARIERLEHEGSKVTAAVGSIIDPLDARPLAPFRVQADHFVLAAGSIHSPLVLLASGLGGPQVGQNLSLQPQSPVAALFADDVIQWRGVPQAAFVDEFEAISAENGLSGFRVEAVSATPGMAAATFAVWGPDLDQFMRSLPKVAASLCLVPDRPLGRVVRQRNGRPKITYTLSVDVIGRMKSSFRAAARVYLAAGATQVMLPIVGSTPVRTSADLAQLSELRVRPASLPMISAHPQGTCRMGPDPATSVVDLDLRVHGIDNLQVIDASIFPTTSSSHTMLPVMTFAHLGARELLG